MNKKMTIKEKIAYLEELSYMTDWLDSKLQSRIEERDEAFERMKENPNDSWYERNLQEAESHITAIEELIEDLNELTK